MIRSHRPETEAGVADADLTGRTGLVTGATSGVGREIALALGRLGADVLVHGRDRERGERVVRDLRDLDSTTAFLPAEFTDLDQVEELASEVHDRTEDTGLDLLVNNAGTHFDSGERAVIGVERTFVANHLAPFLLTNRLRESIPAEGRIVTVASEVHRRGDLDPSERFAEVQRIEGYDGFDAYARSKLANVLFARELARRIDGPIATACHPGFVPGSGLWRHASLPIRVLMAVLARTPRPLTFGVVDSAATAAETPVYLAAASDIGADADGSYFRDCERTDPAPQARDDDLARRLWEWSAGVVDL